MIQPDRDNAVDETERSSQSRKSAIARQLSDIELKLDDTDIPVALDKAAKLPLSEIASLGTAFASVPEMFRTASQTLTSSAGNLYRAILPEGATGVLKAAKGGGSYGFAIMKDGSSKPVTFVPADGVQKVATTVPYDPASLFMAIALMQVNKKLDAIQETQQQMFDYIRDKDKAALRGNLETLSDVLDNYRFNWDNAQFKTNKHILVQQIRNDAEKAIIQHRTQIERKLGSKGFIHIDEDVRGKANSIRDELDEYRLSIFLYSFASFLEVMLLENFDSAYLQAIVERIDNHSLRYRELYTKAYDPLEADADSSIRAMALGGIANAMGFLGKAIEGTSVGGHTQIDKTLQDASKGLMGFNNDIKQRMMSKISDASSSDVRPFIDNIEKIGRLYNEPTLLLADEETLYVVPLEDGAGELEGLDSKDNG